ncbi:MAG: bifunctional DNA primase/polymerase [Dehalococcoidia bacterium]|nr:bifunctional DNA primase/polymerase [Dehalococcoidia bacterium]
MSAFSPFYAESGDPGRVASLWSKGYAVMPVPHGIKGGSGNPKWKGLQTTVPSDEEITAWNTQRRWRDGETAMIFGFDGDSRIHILYDLEIEHMEEAFAHPKWEWLRTSTPVVLSKKSAHILFESPQIWSSSKDAQGHEFRGRGNYTLAPGSLHPASTDSQPILYRYYDPDIASILVVDNLPAFIHELIPSLFPEIPPAYGVVGTAPGGAVEAPPHPAEMGEPPVDSDDFDSTLENTPSDKREESVEEAIRREIGLARRLKVMSSQGEAKQPRKLKTIALFHTVRSMELSDGFSFDTSFLPTPEDLLRLGRRIFRSRDFFNDRDDPRFLRLEACIEGGYSTKECGRYHPHSTHRNDCGLRFCNLCATRTARNLSELSYPGLEGEQHYRITRWASVIAQGPDELRSDYLAALPDRIRDEHKKWAKETLLLTHRKAFHNRFGMRATFYSLHNEMGPDSDEASHVVAYHTLIMVEDKPGELDGPLGRMARRAGLTQIGDLTTQNGEAVAMQAIEMTYCTLVGVDYLEFQTLEGLFDGLYYGTSRSQLFQAYGGLETLLLEQKARHVKQREEAPKVCQVQMPNGEICGSPFHTRKAYPEELPADPRRPYIRHHTAPAPHMRA